MKHLFTVGAVLLLSSCGTIFSGTQQSIIINSNVADAVVYVDGVATCATPCVFNIKRRYEVSLMLKKEGYDATPAVLKAHFNPVSLINLSLIYSWTTDILSGGIWQYAPNSIYVEMKKSNMTEVEQENFQKTSEIKRFILFNFKELKAGKEEYIRSLVQLTGFDATEIAELIRPCDDEMQAIALMTASL